MREYLRRRPEWVYLDEKKEMTPRGMRDLLHAVADRAHVVEQTGRWRVKSESPTASEVRCDVTRWQWLAICAHYEYRCAYCGRRPTGEDATTLLSPDHIIALSRGGDHTAENIAPCCTRCNSWKGTMMLLEWVWQREGLLTVSQCKAIREQALSQAA